MNSTWQKDPGLCPLHRRVGSISFPGTVSLSGQMLGLIVSAGPPNTDDFTWKTLEKHRERGRLGHRIVGNSYPFLAAWFLAP